MAHFIRFFKSYMSKLFISDSIKELNAIAMKYVEDNQKTSHQVAQSMLTYMSSAVRTFAFLWSKYCPKTHVKLWQLAIYSNKLLIGPIKVSLLPPGAAGSSTMTARKLGYSFAATIKLGLWGNLDGKANSRTLWKNKLRTPNTCEVKEVICNFNILNSLRSNPSPRGVSATGNRKTDFTSVHVTNANRLGMSDWIPEFLTKHRLKTSDAS